MATTANDAAPAAGKKTTATAAYKRWKTKLGKLAEGTPDYDAHMLVGHGKGLVTDFVASCARSLVVLDLCSPPPPKEKTRKQVWRTHQPPAASARFFRFITTTKLNKAIIRGFAHRAEKMPGRTGSTQPTA